MANEVRLIDANALLALVQYRLPIDNQNGEVIAGCVDITRRLIKKAPTVDAVDVVHGRWIGETGGYMWRQNCSICNGPVYNKMKPYYNYCPYCGAKMDGGNEQ